MRIQRPIDSGFNHSSTATEVLIGVDLTGKTALITGGHSGLGLESSKALVAAGAKVVVGARDANTAQTKLKDVPNTTVKALDLSNSGSVKQFADDLAKSDVKIDLSPAP